MLISADHYLLFTDYCFYAPVAQWIEHQPPELGVGGSTPLWRASPYVGQDRPQLFLICE